MSPTRTHQLEGRKREERLGELRNMAHHKRGLTDWKGGRGRSRLVSFETQHDTNKDSPTGGEEEQLGELRSVARHKQGLTHWRGGRGRSGLVNNKAWNVTNKESLAGGEEEGVAGWLSSKCVTSQTRTHSVTATFLEAR